MVTSSAKTVQEYLDGLPDDRRGVISKVRDVILRNLPGGYVEHMQYGAITYALPLETFPNTYNKQPLAYLSLAAHKNYYTLYLMGVYGTPGQEDWLRDEFEKAGKRFDFGKSCLRFRKLEDLNLDAVAQVIASTPPRKFIEMYEDARQSSRRKREKKEMG